MAICVIFSDSQAEMMVEILEQCKAQMFLSGRYCREDDKREIVETAQVTLDHHKHSQVKLAHTLHNIKVAMSNPQFLS